ncbi:hypothetical protein CB0940_08419 [Cercospora beticola]|uniref:Integral membrane protein TmpA n=1 Tax=Cercospora beticola TaxID=122368 RepID=A0A2G5HQ50_CERBT|nr:hypothetical protein CB0940_08419 [Cercospora beticola]PIA94352.1 hypothetical protein CB0940_08419 [Cercospora beticola]WPB04995.1 hypothetical protein RHO25_009643 [Cercospora beticola]
MFRKVSWQKDVAEVQAEETHEGEMAEKQSHPAVVTSADGATPLQQSPAIPDIAHVRHHSNSVRRSSVVSFEARRGSIIQSIAGDGNVGQGTIRTSTGQMNRDDRQRSIYSIKAAQESSETDIASLHDGDLPSPAQDLLRAQTAGQYKFTITEHTESAEKNEKTRVSVEVSPLQYTEHIAKKEFLDAYAAKYPLPAIQRRFAWFRYGWFTVYRRLFAIVFTANMSAIIVLASQRARYSAAAIGVGSNIFAAVLARHDNLINAVISIIHLVPLSWPLAIRKRLGKIYCHAGIQAACGTSAAVWYLYFTVLLATDPIPTAVKEGVRIGIYVTTGLIFTCLLILVGMSHPTVRSRHHDRWEQSHRYIGWLLTAIIWIQVGLLTSASETPLYRSPLFWLVLGVTLLLIYPWAMMRKRSFTTTQLSSHALRLEFSHKLSLTGHNIRIAQSPLSDWHGFATIPRNDGPKGFSVIISNAGDWTRSMINAENRKNTIWQRGRLFLGIIEVPMLFSPLVIAATGSGIAPCMAFIQTHPDWPVRIVWSARFPETTYGAHIIETVLKADPNAIIIDTKETGRPDMAALIYAAYKEIKAEAVLCVSTTKVCESVSYEMEARGVPIYVPIFDS